MNFKRFLSIAVASSLLTSSFLSNNLFAYAETNITPSSDTPVSSDTEEKEDEKATQFKCTLNVDNAGNERNSASVTVSEKNEAVITFNTNSDYHISEILINGSALQIKSVYAADDDHKLTLTLEKDTEVDIKFTKNTEKCTVSFLDYDGKVVKTESVEYNKKIDYNAVDTSDKSVFFQQIDITTQIRFAAWDNDVAVARDDITIQALYQKANIAVKQYPTKTAYYFPGQPVDLSGLKVALTIETQLPEFLNNGTRKIKLETIFVEEICYIDCKTVIDIFNSSPDGEVKIYAANSSLPIGSYKISMNKFPVNDDVNKGDVDSSGVVDASDASFTLSVYSDMSTSAVPSITDIQFNRADVDDDGYIDASDASYILSYYALSATGGNSDWDSVIRGGTN